MSRFRAYGYEPVGFTLYANAAVQVWARAVEEVGSLDLAAVVKAMHASQFDTVLGQIGFDKKGDVTGFEPRRWYVWRADGTYMPSGRRTRRFARLSRVPTCGADQDGRATKLSDASSGAHRFIHQQAAVINSIRVYLAEFGIVAPVGRRGVEQLLEVVGRSSRLPAPQGWPVRVLLLSAVNCGH
ncbi:hypothetical protein JQ553_09385 [Bradyrhizobium lablabi]|nr:hypothetical protein [Bradyrhizobium lablabi]